MIRITTTGFTADDLAGWQQLSFDQFTATPLSVTARARTVVHMPNTIQLDEVSAYLADMAAIAIDFPALTDGRGFSLARLIRIAGFTGRLRAVGLLLPHQFRHLCQVGFDEYLASEKTAIRFPESLWQDQLEATSFSYQSRLSGGLSFNQEEPAIGQYQRRDSRVKSRHDGCLGG